jgi:hypothetical protein
MCLVSKYDKMDLLITNLNFFKNIFILLLYPKVPVFFSFIYLDMDTIEQNVQIYKNYY